jgi:hypothetical protein
MGESVAPRKADHEGTRVPGSAESPRVHGEVVKGHYYFIETGTGVRTEVTPGVWRYSRIHAASAMATTVVPFIVWGILRLTGDYRPHPSNP